MSGELDDLDATYRSYETSGRAADRWSATNPGNRAIHEERNAAIETILERCVLDLPLTRLLEVGCGGGALLEELARMHAVSHADCVGVDLLAFRLSAGRAGGRSVPMAQADGQRLPFRDDSFDVVVLSTVLSSVVEDTVARAITTEVDRVLRSGGSVVWYDMRFPNPSNRRVHPLGRRRIVGLFAGYRAEIRSVTLVPQIARRLGRSTRVAYKLLAAVPTLRSHLVGRLTKPG